MKLIVADKNGRTDGVAHAILQKLNIEIPIVLIARMDDFVFNDALLEVDKYVLVCYTEYGWDWDRKNTHVWGKNTDEFLNRLPNGEWNKFDEFVKNNPPIVTFKRELLKKDVTDNLLPIEYPCMVNIPETQSWGEFQDRPISSLFYWGRSHEERVRLHANIWLQSSEKGFAICDNLYYFNQFMQYETNKKKWLSLHIPYYGRIDISNILAINSLSKTSISMAGGGFKCFRTSESSVNSLMVMEKNDFAWSFEWDETNTIQFEIGKEIEAIEHALEHDNIYVKYVKCVENCRRYSLTNYIAHLENTINLIVL